MIRLHLPRRRLLRLALAAPLLPRPGRAEAYPSRPVRLVTGFAAGGPMDIVARAMAPWLSARLGQPFVVENRPGAGGNIGTEAVVRAPADGHTLLVCGPVNAINATLYGAAALGFDFDRDIAPVSGLVRVPMVLVVNPDAVRAETLAAFLAEAQARPGGALAMASAGNGTPQHVAGILFGAMAGIEMLHVPYRGSAPALTDLLGGRVQVMVDALPSALPHIRAGRLRALAVTTAAPATALPGLPSLAEALPGYEASTWYALGAPRLTPEAVLARLDGAVAAGLADPGIVAQLDGLGAVPFPCGPQALGRFIGEETERWGRVVRAAGLRPE